MVKARLRTKTGCFTCRKRRVKCGEERPSCRNCLSCGRQCDWPTSQDLCDRRHLQKSARRRSTSSPHSEPSPIPDAASKDIMTIHRHPNMSSESSGIQSECDLELVYHFLNSFLPVLVLPTWNKSHLMDYQFELVSMMLHCQSVKCAVLATCAANKHILSNDARYQKLALQYYSRAVAEVTQSLIQLSPTDQGPSDSLITAVVYLYLHDLWGSDTTVDPRKHVAGAMKLLNLRYDHEASPLSMARPFHRLTAESVLYQAFLLATRKPFAPNFHVDTQFLTHIESTLRPRQLPNKASADSSPVLGAILSLYHFILDIIHLNGMSKGLDDETIGKFEAEMTYWEEIVFGQNTTDNPSAPPMDFHAGTLALYVLATSLLLDWVMESLTPQLDIYSVRRLDNALPTESRRWRSSRSPQWRINQALLILRQPESVETWSRCYLAAWPMLIFGYAVTAEEDIQLIRQVLHYARERMGYGEIQRILNELENVWDARRVHECS